ncbi:hypothetical protein ACJRO7_011791 [Eucalyptus globulus]|uniref:Homeobox domain-containing protein n=1 Tax=Eucalyptus globulus TaxID=34317 RepID=A0ABD3LLW2_EUCGL
MSPSASTRWCPTPEQLMILEEMYRSGVRTPNAAHIQQITAHLSLYGKIEGKNVFYWFQNHKARDRQKLRRKLSKQLHNNHQCQLNNSLLYNHHHHPHYDHQHMIMNNHHNYHFLSFLHPQSPPPPPAASTDLQFAYYNPTSTLITQGGFGDATAQVMNIDKWTAEMSEKTTVEMEKLSKKMYSDLKPMTIGAEVVSTLPVSLSRPALKTLDLFPTRATNLKEERNNLELSI